MELDSIKKIIQAEEESKNKVKQAEEEAEKILKLAIDSRSSKEIFAKKRIEEKRQLLEQKAKEENEDKIRKIREMTKQECDTLEKNASEKMDIAVEAIFKEVMS